MTGTQPTQTGERKVKPWIFAAIALACALLAFISYKIVESRTDAKAWQTINDFSTIKAHILQNYSRSPSYGTTELTDTVSTWPAIQQRMTRREDNKNILRNAWGGIIRIFPTGIGNGFRVDFPDIPPDACSKILVYSYSLNTTTGIRGISIYLDEKPFGDDPVIIPPISLSVATEACNYKRNATISIFTR